MIMCGECLDIIVCFDYFTQHMKFSMCSNAHHFLFQPVNVKKVLLMKVEALVQYNTLYILLSFSSKKQGWYTQLQCIATSVNRGQLSDLSNHFLNAYMFII